MKLVLLVLATVALSLAVRPNERYSNYDALLKALASRPAIQKKIQEQIRLAPQGQGEPGFTCDDVVSAQVPTSAHKLRPGDFQVVGAIGDSIQAGNGAEADVITQATNEYRGKVFTMGGDDDLDRHVTIANILKKFNPELKGQSFDEGEFDEFDIAQFNAAIPGAVAQNMLSQAEFLVQTMRDHPELVDIQNDWKLVNIFIGGNDLCDVCMDGQSPEEFVEKIKQAIRLIKQNLPRTLVNVINLPRFDMLVQVMRTAFICRIVIPQVCPCAFRSTAEEHAAASIAFQQAIDTLEKGEFDDQEDFTVVVQQALVDSTEPPMQGGDIDTTPFAPDCFHLSTKGHEMGGRAYWNNMLQPIGQKTRNTDLNIADAPLNCPDPSCPFIRTTRNSGNCEL